METQIVCPFTLELAQMTSERRFLAAFVFQMSADVALEFVALETSDAAVDAVVFNVIRFCICNNTVEYLIRLDVSTHHQDPEKSWLEQMNETLVTTPNR